ncbi:MAG: hypothetical protein ACREJQ_07275 [bacterium]
MNKKALLATLAVFVLTSVLNYVIHGMLLKNAYMQRPELMRPADAAGNYMGAMWVAFLVFSLAFVWIYQYGVENKPWMGQGIRYGLATWMLVSVPRYLIYYAVEPLEKNVPAMQIGYELPMMVVLGLTVAALMKK